MKCTGKNCPMQNGTVDPAHCLADECPYITKPMTNADRIRAMTDEELAEWLSDMRDSVTCPNGGAIDCNLSCKRCWLDWLKKEVEDAWPQLAEKPKDISEGVHRYIEGKQDSTGIDVKKVLRTSMRYINVYEISEQIALGSLADWCFTLKTHLASVLAQLTEDEGIE